MPFSPFGRRLLQIRHKTPSEMPSNFDRFWFSPIVKISRGQKTHFRSIWCRFRPEKHPIFDETINFLWFSPHKTLIWNESRASNYPHFRMVYRVFTDPPYTVFSRFWHFLSNFDIFRGFREGLEGVSMGILSKFSTKRHLEMKFSTKRHLEMKFCRNYIWLERN